MGLHEREHTQSVPGGGTYPEDRVQRAAIRRPKATLQREPTWPGGRIKEEHRNVMVWSRT